MRPANASTSASERLHDIAAQAVDVLMQAEQAEILLKEVFHKLDELDTGDEVPALAAINCFTTCTARAVVLMREAADNIVALAAEGGAQ